MRKLAWVCGGFSGAVFLWNYLLPAPWVIPLGLLCALTGAIAALAGSIRRVALCALGLAAGLLWSAGYSALFFAPAQALDGFTVPVSLTVTDFPAPTTAGAKVNARLTLEGSPDVAILYYASAAALDLRPGDQVEVTAQLRLSSQIYGQEVTWHTAKGVFLLAYARGDPSVTRPSSTPWWCLPAYWGKALGETLAQTSPADTGPLTTAVVTGDRTGLSDSLLAALSRTGLTHTVAVSGMHIGFLVTALSLLLGRHRRRTALVCIPVALFFMLAIGISPSVARAVVMQFILLLAPLLGRENDGPTSLTFALALLLLQNPFAAASVSLQLSFAAVAGLTLLSPGLQDWLARRLLRRGKGWRVKLWNGVFRFLISTLAASVGAIVFTAPLTAYYFSIFSLIALPANLLALTAVSLTFVGGLLGAVVGLFWLPLGSFVALVFSPAPRYLLWLVPQLARVPFAALNLTSPYYWFWLGYLYLLLLLLWRMKGQRRLVFSGCGGAIALAAAILLTGLSDRTGRLTVTALDVGQGQSVVLTSGQATALVDCGGNSLNNPGDTAADWLSARGRTQVDALILTHFHADHANGVAELLERLPVALLVLPDAQPGDPLRLEIEALARRQSVPVTYLTQTATLPLGAAQLTLYPPLGDGGSNEEGLSVLATAGDYDALITGDMNSYVEARLVKYGNLPDCELFIAGHHGSKSSNSALLLETITPETVILSVGYNTYGHPTQEAMLRLSQAGADLYRTDLMGAVTVRAN